MKRIILISTLLFSIVPFALKAQESETVSQSVTVVKDFVPTVKPATKITFRPAAEPAVVLDAANINYNILYRSEPFTPLVNPLSMPGYERTYYERLYSGYVDAMIGYKWQSKINAYYTTKIKRDLILGAGFNSYGFYDKLRNDYGEKESALDSDNTLGLLLKYRTGNFEINADGFATYRRLNRYGYVQGLDQSIYDQQQDFKQHFIRAHANVAVGMPETQERLLNAHFIGFIYFLGDRAGNTERTMEAGFSASTRWLAEKHKVSLDVEYIVLSASNGATFKETVQLPNQTSQFAGGDEIRPYSTVYVSPIYSLRAGILDLEAGAKMTFNVANKWYGTGAPAFNPVAKVQLKFLKGAIVPYAALDGEYKYNNFYNLSICNPYVADGLTARNSNENTVYVGLKGDVAGRFRYDLHFGYEMTKNMMLFVNTGSGNVFSAATVDEANAIAAEATAEYDITSRFYVGAGWRYASYKVSYDIYNGLPYDLPRNMGSFRFGYRDVKKFSGELTLNYQSRRVELAYLNTDSPIGDKQRIPTDIKPKADLSLSLSYRIGKRVGIKAELNNLFNSKLYEYNYYRGIGFNGSVGASFLF